MLKPSRFAVATIALSIMISIFTGTARADSGLTLTAVVSSSWGTGGDDQVLPGTPSADGITRLGGQITQHVGPWSLSIARIYNQDFNLGRVTNYAGKFVYPGFVDDATDNASFAYAFRKIPLTLSAGWHDRYRLCCTGTRNTPVPVREQYWYFEADGGVGPITKFGHIVSLSAFSAFVPHKGLPEYPNPAFGAPGASQFIAGQGDKTLFTGIVTITVPIDKSQTAAVFGSYANNFEYYYAYALPTFYNNVTWGFIKNFPANVSYSASVTNYYQHLQGYPFVYPNTVNLTLLYMSVSVSLKM